MVMNKSFREHMADFLTGVYDFSVLFMPLFIVITALTLVGLFALFSSLSLSGPSYKQWCPCPVNTKHPSW